MFRRKIKYKQKNDDIDIDQDSLVDDIKKICWEYITDTGENQINCKVFIKIGDYSVAKVVKLDSISILRDVLKKYQILIILKKKILNFISWSILKKTIMKTWMKQYIPI